MERFDDQFIDELRSLAADTEKLLTATSEQTGAEVARLRTRLQNSLKNMQGQIVGIEKTVIEQARTAAKSTDRYVHENTWTSIGLASIVGIAAGILIGRR